MTDHTVRASVIAAVLFALFAAHASADEAEPAGDHDQQQASQKEGVRVTIYPILVQAPIFGASIDLPSLPSRPGGGGDDGSEVKGETDLSLNGAALYGFKIEADRWFAEFNGVWADVSAERTLPRVVLDTNTRLYSARGGVRVFGGFSATGGVRRITSDLTATLTLSDSNQTISGTTKPGLWDPLVGVDWRGRKGKVTVDTSFQGGGFGVGTDVELEGDAHADWEFVRHFVLRAGYSIFYYKMTIDNVSIGRFQRTLVTKQTLNGPAVGIGIVF